MNNRRINKQQGKVSPIMTSTNPYGLCWQSPYYGYLSVKQYLQVRPTSIPNYLSVSSLDLTSKFNFEKLFSNINYNDDMSSSKSYISSNTNNSIMFTPQGSPEVKQIDPQHIFDSYDSLITSVLLEESPSPLSPALKSVFLPPPFTDQVLEEHRTNYMSCVFDASEEHGSLYIGDLECAEKLHAENALNISAVLSIDRTKKFQLPSEFEHMKIVVYDHGHERIKSHFDATYAFITEALARKKNVLVHCRRGISRSVTIVIAFLMKYLNVSFQEAHSHLQQCRPIIKPNDGFIAQLQSYEQDIDQYLEITNQQSAIRPEW